jgi:hypothetical protein
MTWRGLVALVLAACVAACSHTRSVGSGEESSAAEQAGPPYDENAPAKHRPGRVAEANAGPRTFKSTGGVPLSTSPVGLLKPGAAKRIQERLVGQGGLSADQLTGQLDGPTRSALARFQTANDLPPTGDPDDATVKKLGLDAADIFVSGQ